MEWLSCSDTGLSARAATTPLSHWGARLNPASGVEGLASNKSRQANHPVVGTQMPHPILNLSQSTPSFPRKLKKSSTLMPCASASAQHVSPLEMYA
ncbi:hypothetical protein IG631_19514 [Alternaria alternata]|nr:hypothetical protein IG631_19514 [Alternaria alternata]